jgi:hypothetical protein
VTEPYPAERVLTAAQADLENCKRLLAEHLGCQAPRPDPATPSGECPKCRSLGRHLERCERQVYLLASVDLATEELF